MLPDAFLAEMRDLLGDGYGSWAALMEEPHPKESKGIRLNTLKAGSHDFEKSAFPLSGRVPWTENGYYIEDGFDASHNPFYAAGLYYIQEPSAMLPAAALPVEKGDRVLDLCAAPGGKATELAAKLGGTGLLLANDISASRARALLKNLELFGAAGILVTGESPQRLCGRFGGYFDKILVDAPCSGEGMFRQKPSMGKDWLEKGPSYYAPLQKEILHSAAEMLSPGGLLLYSTCTFSVTENEENVLWLLRSGLGFEVLPISLSAVCEGFCSGRPDLLEDLSLSREEEEALGRCVRLYPHRVRGEGHFAALLKKNGGGTKSERGRLTEFSRHGAKDTAAADLRPAGKAEMDVFRNFASCLGTSFDEGRIYVSRNRLYLLPPCLEADDFKGLRVLRSGLYLGDVKGRRFEPSQALAMYLKKEDFCDTVNLPAEDQRVVRYLKGETLDIEDLGGADGRKLVCVDGYPLGWGNCLDGRLKNKYCPGWRW